MKTGKKIAIIILIIGILLLVTGIVLFIAGIGRSKWETESFTETFDEEIKAIEINCDIGELIIEHSSDATNAEVKCVEVIADKFDVTLNDGTLIIEYQSEKWHKYISIGTLNDDISKGEIYVTLPEKELDKMAIKTGAGETSINSLTVKNADIYAGIGEFTISDCSFTKEIDIKTGIGDFVVKNSVLNNLDFDAGIGKSSLKKCDLTGICKIDNGVGEVSISLTRSRDYYSFDLDNGVGDIDIDGEKMLDEEVADKTIISIANGIGSIDVQCAS